MLLSSVWRTAFNSLCRISLMDRDSFSLFISRGISLLNKADSLAGYSSLSLAVLEVHCPSSYVFWSFFREDSCYSHQLPLCLTCGLSPIVFNALSLFIFSTLSVYCIESIESWEFYFLVLSTQCTLTSLQVYCSLI